MGAADQLLPHAPNSANMTSAEFRRHVYFRDLFWQEPYFDIII
jgi:hypothetical protein